MNQIEGHAVDETETVAATGDYRDEGNDRGVVVIVTIAKRNVVHRHLLQLQVMEDPQVGKAIVLEEAPVHRMNGRVVMVVNRNENGAWRGAGQIVTGTPEGN